MSEWTEKKPFLPSTSPQVVYGKGCFLGVPVLLASTEREVDGLSGWELGASASSELERRVTNRLYISSHERPTVSHVVRKFGPFLL